MSLHCFSCRAMHFLKSKPTLPFPYSLSNFSRCFLSLFSTVISPQTPASAEHIAIIDYLNSNFKFSKAQSIYISKRLPQGRCPHHPWSVLDYFKQIGFSETQIQCLVSRQPKLLFSRIDKTLKPKIEYLQLQGFEGSELSKLLCKNPHLLTYDLNKSLAPFLETVRKIAYNKEDFIRVLYRSGSWIITNHQIILHNAAFLESCGIMGSQLSMLLTRRFRLFSAPESLIQSYVSRAINMGFHLNSRMLAHAICSISNLSLVKFNRKFELIKSFGFSEDEIMQMFRRTPALLNASEKKMKFGIQVCLETIMLPKSLIVNNPVILSLSIEKRLLPRWRVLQLLISKDLLPKHPSVFKVIKLKEEKFLDDYILKFRDEKEALLEVYKFPCLEDASA